MTFRDLKLSNLSKKKKLTLYKCWILEPLGKGAPIRQLELNTSRDRYALSVEKAVEYAINQFDHKELKENTLKAIIFGESKRTLQDAYLVIGAITLPNGCMDEEVIIPPHDDYSMDLDPHFDPTGELLTATVEGRIEDFSLKNYTIRDLFVSLEDATDILRITKLTLDEVVINQSVTGGK